MIAVGQEDIHFAPGNAGTQLLLDAVLQSHQCLGHPDIDVQIPGIDGFKFKIQRSAIQYIGGFAKSCHAFDHRFPSSFHIYLSIIGKGPHKFKKKRENKR
ncbi:hypothetical protein SDC9_178602 [bioreactor metagenome]|uniref:Uncharacterized protein n=1 Tax=bioreactor metagenome TaxID=1076179 RepID=A0A645GWM4_9ZZZZ